MSWDAELRDDATGNILGEWNYTHNCNGMANAVLYPDHEQQSTFDEVFRPQRESWWKVLDGMDGPRGRELLDRIINGLEMDPGRFIAMNPPNGWGNYTSFLVRLGEMRETVPSDPYEFSTWRVWG